VTGQAPHPLKIEGVPEAWFRETISSVREPSNSEFVSYRPAVLIECTINFRSLRAGLNHSEERSFTAWVPRPGLAVDWGVPAVSIEDVSQISAVADSQIEYSDSPSGVTRDDFQQFQTELVDQLVRSERLKLFFNPVFGLFSTPGEKLDDFLPKIAEAALSRVEPELKRLRTKFELRLEQVREAQASKGMRTEDINTEDFISRKLRFFASENRLADMFSTLAGSVFGTTDLKQVDDEWRPDETELREDLDRIEHEASHALRALYDEYLSLANEYDIYEIGLQPDNIQVMRRVLLWVPVSGASARPSTDQSHS